MSIAATRMYRSLSEFLSSNLYDILSHLRVCLVLTILAQRHGSSQKTLPTSSRSSRTALETDDTSTVHPQDSILQEKRSGSRMDEKTLGKPHAPTLGPASDHVETDAKK